MNGPQPDRLTGTTNELAKERNRAAAERTINTWLGNCLTFIGIGVAFDQITESLRYRFPQQTPLVTTTLSYILGMMFIAFGLGLLGIALVQHRIQIKAIERDDYVLSSISRLNTIAVSAIVLTGFLGFVIVLFLL